MNVAKKPKKQKQKTFTELYTFNDEFYVNFCHINLKNKQRKNIFKKYSLNCIKCT